MQLPSHTSVKRSKYSILNQRVCGIETNPHGAGAEPDVVNIGGAGLDVNLQKIGKQLLWGENNKHKREERAIFLKNQYILILTYESQGLIDQNNTTTFIFPRSYECKSKLCTRY